MDGTAIGLLGLMCFTCIGVECCVYCARRAYEPIAVVEPLEQLQPLEPLEPLESLTLSPIFIEVTEVDPAKFLTDQDGKHSCIICTEEMNETITECVRCNKYIGHAACIHQWIHIELQQHRLITCPYCRQI